MLKKTITYTDYDGVERKEDFYFNLSRAEVAEMELGTEGGMQKFIERILNTQDTKRLIELFKDLILKSYGEKSPDGRRFIKSKELSEAFSQTEAYTELFMELATDADKAAEFVNGITPNVPMDEKTAKEVEAAAKAAIEAPASANLSASLTMT